MKVEFQYCDFCGRKVKNPKPLYAKGFAAGTGRIEFDACPRCYDIMEPLAYDLFRKLEALGDAFEVCFNEVKLEFARQALICFDEEQIKVCDDFYERVRTLEKER